MRIVRAALLAAAVATGCTEVAIIEYGGGFPAVMSENLQGQTVRIPEDLEGRANIVVVGYAPGDRAAMDAWAGIAAPMLRKENSVALYSLWVAEKLTALGRTLSDTNIRLRVGDPAERARTVTVYTDVAQFNRELGVEGRRAPRAFVLDRDGRIIWRAEGAPTAKSAADMGRAVRKLAG